MEEQKRVYDLIAIAWKFLKPYIVNPPKTDAEWDECIAAGTEICKAYNHPAVTKSELKLFTGIITNMIDYLNNKNKEEADE